MVVDNFLSILLTFLSNSFYAIVNLFTDILRFLDFGFEIVLNGVTYDITVGAILFGGGFIIYLTYILLSPFE